MLLAVRFRYYTATTPSFDIMELNDQQWRKSGWLTAIILKGTPYLILNNHIPFNYVLKTFQTAYLAPLSRVY